MVRRGTETTGPELGHSVHVELAGLAAGPTSPTTRTRATFVVEGRRLGLDPA